MDFPEKKAKAGHAPGGYSRGVGRLDGGPWRGRWVSVDLLAAAAPLLPQPQTPKYLRQYTFWRQQNFRGNYRGDCACEKVTRLDTRDAQ